jgi:hypothetical protein
VLFPILFAFRPTEQAAGIRGTRGLSLCESDCRRSSKLLGAWLPEPRACPNQRTAAPAAAGTSRRK